MENGMIDAFAHPTSPALPVHWVDQHPEQHSPAPTRAWQWQLHALASVLFATDAGAPPAERLNWVVFQVSDILSKVRGKGAFVYRLSLLVVAWVAPLMIFRFPTMRRLSFEQRVRALGRFERSPLGLMLFAIKALLCITYYEHPDAVREVGFDGIGMGEAHHD